MADCGKNIRYLDPNPKPRTDGKPVPIEEAGGWIYAPCTKEAGHVGRCVNRSLTCGEPGPEVAGALVYCERHADANNPPESADDPIHKNAHRASGGDGEVTWNVEWARKG